jgi:hypothetical protein
LRLFSSNDSGCATPANWQKEGAKLPIMGDDYIMSKKDHGTYATPVMENLKYAVDAKNADKICNFNRHYAEVNDLLFF